MPTLRWWVPKTFLLSHIHMLENRDHFSIFITFVVLAVSLFHVILWSSCKWETLPTNSSYQWCRRPDTSMQGLPHCPHQDQNLLGPWWKNGGRLRDLKRSTENDNNALVSLVVIEIQCLPAWSVQSLSALSNLKGFDGAREAVHGLDFSYISRGSCFNAGFLSLPRGNLNEPGLDVHGTHMYNICTNYRYIERISPKWRDWCGHDLMSTSRYLVADARSLYKWI